MDATSQMESVYDLVPPKGTEQRAALDAIIAAGGGYTVHRDFQGAISRVLATLGDKCYVVQIITDLDLSYTHEFGPIACDWVGAAKALGVWPQGAHKGCPQESIESTPHQPGDNPWFYAWTESAPKTTDVDIPSEKEKQTLKSAKDYIDALTHAFMESLPSAPKPKMKTLSPAWKLTEQDFQDAPPIPKTLYFKPHILNGTMTSSQPRGPTPGPAVSAEEFEDRPCRRQHLQAHLHPVGVGRGHRCPRWIRVAFRDSTPG